LKPKPPGIIIIETVGGAPMAVTTWDPFRELLTLQEKLDKMYREIDRARKGDDFVTSEWTPPVDIFEAKDRFVIKVEIPEVEKESIDINIRENELTIKGERKTEAGVDPESYHRMERGYGTFTRTFTLTKGLDATNIKASVKDGVLRIELPKKEEAKPKQIKIEV
jgi:HSP20 family protein